VVATRAKRTGPLCDRKPNSDFPTASVSGLGSKSTPFAGGVPARAEVTWVNLWAAWCEPCKKEIPLLIEFQKKLSAESMRIGLSFVSVDEDQRQLQQFLDQQPPTGLRETFWLKEGPERDEWLPKVGLGVDPRLPVHLIVDATGKVACQIDGSIEPGDYEEIRALVRSL
jgi:thiol-disulfide isomerase/thioredoxin